METRMAKKTLAGQGQSYDNAKSHTLTFRYGPGYTAKVFHPFNHRLQKVITGTIRIFVFDANGEPYDVQETDAARRPAAERFAAEITKLAADWQQEIERSRK